MLRTTKTFLNASFLIVAAAGFGVIFFDQWIDSEYVFFAPTVLVFLYALLVHRLLNNCYEHSLSDHHIDSIYFMGFLFTLFSLITLFYRLQSGLDTGEGDAGIARVFYYVGVSVSTSIAGVLFRNMARGAWLRDHPEEPDDLEKSYELLKTIADSFSTNYRETFSQIQLFLSERQQSLSVLSDKEKSYLASLNRFIEVTDRFSGGLDQSGRELSTRLVAISGTVKDLGDTVTAFNSLGAQFAETTARLHQQAETSPMSAVNGELEQFNTGVRELNLVLDSLISVLESKVERIR